MKYRKMRPIFKFTVVNSELSTSEQCRHMRNMAGLCRTSHIRLWEKVRKRTVPDLRKTNRTHPPVTECVGLPGVLGEMTLGGRVKINPHINYSSLYFGG